MEITPGRLQEIREALLFGEQLDGDARLELLAILESIISEHSARGRPTDAALRQRAGVVGVLLERHGVTLKPALFAAWPAATAHERASLERAFRRLRSSGEMVRVPERFVRTALSEIDRGVKKNRRRK